MPDEKVNNEKNVLIQPDKTRPELFPIKSNQIIVKNYLTPKQQTKGES